MVRLVNRAKMTTATTGTGTVSLGVASEGFQTFAGAGIVDGDLVRYVIEEGDNFEIGTGVFGSAGGTLTRNPSESSAGGGAITLAGSALVFVTAASTDIQQPPAEGPFVDGDKTKLNGIAAGAQVNTVTSVAGRTGAVTLDVADVSGAFPASAIPAGTKMLFAQTTAPTGWTKDTTHNNKALRVVSGTAGSGGSLAFTTAFGNRTTGNTAAGGTVAGHTLSVAQIPSHTHPQNVTANFNTGGPAFRVDFGGDGSGAGVFAQGANTNSTGGNGSHAHGFTGASHAHGLDMQVQFVDIIIAAKA